MMQSVNVLHDPSRGLSMSNYINGRDRPIYFKRPLVATMTDVPLRLAQPPVIAVNNQLNIQIEENRVSNVREIEIQTDYRDSQSQTDPYTTVCIVPEGQNPEIKLLEKWRYGDHLPAILEDVELIEWNREKQWFEQALPPISDEASFMLRRMLMQEQEVREWKKKESEIRKQNEIQYELFIRVQNESLYLLQSALSEREKDVEERNAQRIEEIKIKKTEQKNRLVAKIQRRKIKVLRKMMKSRKELETDSISRDIIEEYANFASKVYAGITRDGLSLDKIANKYEVQPIALTSYPGISDLTTTIKPSILETRVNVTSFQKQIEKDYTRSEAYHKGELKKAQERIEGKNTNKDTEEEIKDLNKYSLNKMKVRPPTPTWKYNKYFLPIQSQDQELSIDKVENLEVFKAKASELQANDKRQAAVILLQRLIRGRAMQNIMYEGKEKRLALIEELLTVAKIPDLPEAEAEEILMQQHEEKIKNTALEALQGEIIAETMDLLSKELLRVKQEKQIAMMVDVAERDRRMREIQEAGRRQAQETLRKREDVLYNQIMRVHQGTVDTYLDWIIKNTLQLASSRQATIMTNLRKSKMNAPVEHFERRFNNNETIIKDLVQQFLIPNVQRSKLQKQIQIEERRFNEAAKKSLQTTTSRAASQINQK